MQTLRLLANLKETIALIILAVCAYTDIKEKYIYLMPLLVGGIASFALSVMIFMQDTCEGAQRNMLSLMLFPIAFSIFIVMLGRLCDGMIGMGDIYLIAMLSMSIGVIRDVRTVSASVIIAGVSCFCMLIFGKAKRWSKIPFAPFLLAGFMSVMILGIGN